MKTRTRILSFLLALVLMFGCLQTAVFAVTELEGGEITEEDVAAGKTDALTGKIPEPNGIMTGAEISALIGSANLVANFDYTKKGNDSNDFQNILTDEATGRKYIKVSESPYTLDAEGNKVLTTKYTCGSTEETFIQISSKYTNNHANVARNYLNHKGKAIVISTDIRLEEGYNITQRSLVDIRTYLAAKNGALTNISLNLVQIKSDGSLIVSGKTLEKKVNKSTAEQEAEFTNVAIHIIPEDNTFEVYVDGVCQTKNIDSVLINDTNNKYMTFENVKYTASGTTYYLSSDGYKDFTFSRARFMHVFCTYHGKYCDTVGCTTQHEHLETCAEDCAEAHHTEECATPCKTALEDPRDHLNPMAFEGDQFSLSNTKAYYSDLFLECTEHDIKADKHTHDEENLTSTAHLTCANCNADWNVTVPMDRTGNAFCDLCEIDNKDSAIVGDFHTGAEIASFIKTTAGTPYVKDGTKDFSTNNAAGVTKTDGYYVFGANDAQFFDNAAMGDFSGGGDATLKNYNTSNQRGLSFVVQADVRLGENFYAQGRAFELFKVTTYATDSTPDNDKLESLFPIVAKISKTGDVIVRDAATSSSAQITVAKLDNNEFASIAIHVKTGAVAQTTKYGLYDVYVNGELVKSNLQFLTEDEEAMLHVDATIGNYAIKVDGIKDFTYSWTRMFHTYANNLTLSDVLHVDNMLAYYSDTYEGSYTKHDIVSEHTHDYSKKCTSYSTYCTICGAGNGGVAVLDANGDKLCDICTNEQIDTSANGVISPSKLSSVINSDDIVIATDITDTEYYGFSYVNNGSGCASFKTEDGNSYLAFNAKTTASGETFLDIRHHNSSNKMIANFENYAGRSFVYSVDVRLDEGYNNSLNLFQILSYNVPSATDENGNATSFTSLNRIFAVINTAGELRYRDGATATSSSVNKTVPNFTLEKGATEYTTLSIHVRPTEGKYGLYTLYADGVPVIEDVQFLTESDSKSITWTMADGTKSEGAKDYVFGFVRSFHVMSSTVLADNALSVDNPKFYYSDTFAECAKHNFVLGGHTHNSESGEITASFSCSYCNAVRTMDLPIDTLGNGKCDSCDVFILDGGALVTKKQVVLGDLISVNVFADIPDKMIEDAKGKVVMKVGDRTEEYSLADVEKNSDGESIFGIKLKSTEMTAPVTMTIKLEDGSSKTYTTSVRDYAMDLLKISENEYERELVKQMLNFGSYAQKYFAEKNNTELAEEDLANALLNEEDTVVSDIAASDLSSHKIILEGEAADVSINSAALVLSSTTSMKIFFTAPAESTVKVDGNTVTPTVTSDGYYCVTISDILPHQLDDVHTVAVTTAAGSTLTAKVSVLSAAYALLCSSEAENFKNVGRALYLYNVAAAFYKSTASVNAEVVVKDGAKGAVALVLDDGNQTAANYAASYMQKYDKTVASFALITSHFATLQKSGDSYVMTEDGKYTYTQNADQINKTNYWYDFLAKTDVNGNKIGDRTELISHSYSHALPKDGDNYAELLGARHIIQGLFGYNSEAIITPGGFGKDDAYTAAKDEIYIAGRGTNASESVFPMINTLSEFDKAKRTRLDSFMVQYNKMWLTDAGEFSAATITAEEALNAANAANGIADVSHVEDFIDCAMENGGLAAFCIHGIVPTTYNGGLNESGLHIYDEQADAVFAYVQKYAETGDLWSATFSDAVIYFSEWNTSTLDVRKIGDSLIGVSLTDEEDDSIFDMALTVKVSVDDSWTGARIVGGEALEIKGEAGARYVLVNVKPDSEIVMISKA